MVHFSLKNVRFTQNTQDIENNYPKVKFQYFESPWLQCFNQTFESKFSWITSSIWRITHVSVTCKDLSRQKNRLDHHNGNISRLIFLIFCPMSCTRIICQDILRKQLSCQRTTQIYCLLAAFMIHRRISNELSHTILIRADETNAVATITDEPLFLLISLWRHFKCDIFLYAFRR